MNSRYDRAIKYQTGGIQFHGIRKPVVIPPRPDDRFHEVILGDRVDKLAYRYLGDASLWFVICDVNDIPFPLDLTPGLKLRIPSRTAVDAQL